MIWTIGLLIGAIATVAISYRNVRGMVWVGLASVVFALSVAYQHSGLPLYSDLDHQPAVVLALDLILCLIIDTWRKYEWELQLYKLYRLSVIASIVTIFEMPFTAMLYVPVLETINWLALLIISGNSLLTTGMVGRNVESFISARLTDFRCSARQIRTTPAKTRWYKRWS